MQKEKVRSASLIRKESRSLRQRPWLDKTDHQELLALCSEAARYLKMGRLSGQLRDGQVVPSFHMPMVEILGMMYRGIWIHGRIAGKTFRYGRKVLTIGSGENTVAVSQYRREVFMGEARVLTEVALVFDRVLNSLRLSLQRMIHRAGKWLDDGGDIANALIPFSCVPDIVAIGGLTWRTHAAEDGRWISKDGSELASLYKRSLATREVDGLTFEDLDGANKVLRDDAIPAFVSMAPDWVECLKEMRRRWQ